MRIMTMLRSGGDFAPIHVQALQRQVARWAPFAQFTCLSDVPIGGVETVPFVHNWPGWWIKMGLFDPSFKGDFLVMDLDTVIVGPLDDLFRVNELAVLAQRRQVGPGAFVQEFSDCFINLPEKDRQKPGECFRIAPELVMGNLPGSDNFLYAASDDMAAVLKTGKAALLRDFYRDGTKYREGLGSGLMYLPEAERASPWECFIKQPSQLMQIHKAGGDQRLLETHYLKNALRWQDVLPGQIVSYKVHCCENRLGKGFVFKGVPDGARVIAFHGQPRPWHTEKFKDLY